MSEPGKPWGIKVKLDRGIRARDRAAWETREMVFDRGSDHYTQEWTGPDSGEVTFRKKGKNSDPKMHGLAAYKPTKPRA